MMDAAAFRTLNHDLDVRILSLVDHLDPGQLHTLEPVPEGAEAWSAAIVLGHLAEFRASSPPNCAASWRTRPPRSGARTSIRSGCSLFRMRRAGPSTSCAPRSAPRSPTSRWRWRSSPTTTSR